MEKDLALEELSGIVRFFVTKFRVSQSPLLGDSLVVEVVTVSQPVGYRSDL